MTTEDLTDWLENAIDDSFDLGWTSRDAATLIVSRMQAEGLVLIAREGMRQTLADVFKAGFITRRDGKPYLAAFNKATADAAIAALTGRV